MLTQEHHVELKEKLSIARRPCFGELGKKIRLQTNFFKISFPAVDIAQYEVKTEPECTANLKRFIWDSISISDGGGLDLNKVIYDKRTHVLVCPADLIVPKQLLVGLKPNDGFEMKFIVTFERIGTVDMSKMHRYLTSRAVAVPKECLEVMDIIFRHRPSLLYSPIGKSFFTRKGSVSLSGGAECWQGFHQSVELVADKALLNLDVSATAFIEPVSFPELLARFMGKASPDDFKYGVSESERCKFERMCKGLKFSINHRGTMRKRYRVAGIIKTIPGNTMFSKEEGSPQLTVQDYFLTVYGVKLKYPHLPCVAVEAKSKVLYFPMEFCDLVEGQRHQKKLNEVQTARMIRQTCQTPDLRKRKIQNGLAEMRSSNDESPQLQNFGFGISNEMMSVVGRVLPPPVISFNSSSSEPTCTPKDGAWNLRNKKLAVGAHLISWAICYFAPNEDKKVSQIQAFTKELMGVSMELGLDIVNKSPEIFIGTSTLNTVENTLTCAWANAGQQTHHQPQLLLCFLPVSGISLYAEIKHICDTILGVASQCIQMKHVYSPKRQYCSNVVLKLNAKLGGVNSFLTANQIPFLSHVPSIIFGCDVLQPTTGDRNQKATTALVASMDAKANHYATSVGMQPAGREIVDDMKHMAKELLMNFYRVNNRNPQRILFYRDGISESQFNEVLQCEVKAVRNACLELEAGYTPPITFVVVHKRHHTRFFPTEDSESNTPAGTVVERDITEPTKFDFYLCSHAGLQGTSRPTRYHVIFDENGFTADSMQELTYRLCYTYARCTRAVSICPPVYYANLVAFRSKFHLLNPLGDRSIHREHDMDFEVGGVNLVPVKAPLDQVLYFL